MKHIFTKSSGATAFAQPPPRRAGPAPPPPQRIFRALARASGPGAPETKPEPHASSPPFPHRPLSRPFLPDTKFKLCGSPDPEPPRTRLGPSNDAAARTGVPISPIIIQSAIQQQ